MGCVTVRIYCGYSKRYEVWVINIIIDINILWDNNIFADLDYKYGANWIVDWNWNEMIGYHWKDFIKLRTTVTTGKEALLIQIEKSLD